MKRSYRLGLSAHVPCGSVMFSRCELLLCLDVGNNWFRLKLNASALFQFWVCRFGFCIPEVVVAIQQDVPYSNLLANGV